VALHFAFILFVVGGAVLVWRWPRVVFVHLPAAIWGTWVELADQACPLTALEAWCRARAGSAGYAEGFLEHYLLAAVYPTGLTRGVQVGLGIVALLLNAGLYTALLAGRRRRAKA
jgi:hypothetical protein